LTRWARQGINVDVAMKASRPQAQCKCTSVTSISKETDIAAAFGTSQIATGIVTDERLDNRK
jgi:hypothetical protein